MSKSKSPAKNVTSVPVPPADVPDSPAVHYRTGTEIADSLLKQAADFLKAAQPGKSSDSEGVSVDGLRALAVAVVFPAKLGDEYGTPALTKSGAILASPARKLALSAAFAQAEPAHAIEVGGFINAILRRAGLNPDAMPFVRADKRDTGTGKQAMTLAPRWAAPKGEKASGI